jgi:hypothetical protein
MRSDCRFGWKFLCIDLHVGNSVPACAVGGDNSTCKDEAYECLECSEEMPKRVAIVLASTGYCMLLKMFLKKYLHFFFVEIKNKDLLSVIMFNIFIASLKLQMTC